MNKKKWFNLGLISALLGLGGILLGGILVGCGVIPPGAEEPLVSFAGYGLLALSLIGTLIVIVSGESGFPKR